MVEPTVPNLIDPPEIYLQPKCCAESGEGQVWRLPGVDPLTCEDTGAPWTRYLRADVASHDLHAALAGLNARIEQLKAERDEAREIVCVHLVEADHPGQAIEKVCNGEGELIQEEEEDAETMRVTPEEDRSE
jgi:hypothetical protein